MNRSAAILILLVAAGITWKYKKAWSETERFLYVFVIGSILFVLTTRIEGFADQSADEAGLVFGIPPSTMSAAPMTLYSGNTVSFLSTAKQYLGASSTGGRVGMNDASSMNNILPNLRVQFLDQTDFRSLQPVFHAQNVSLLHQSNGIDKCLSVDPASGMVRYDSDLTIGKSYGSFKLLNATDVKDGSLISIQDKILIQYVGDSAASNSYIYMDPAGLKATGTLSNATVFTIQTCMGTKCGGPNWRFQ